VWGTNVRSIRRLKGLSMDAFALGVGVSVATVSRWEAGKMAPKDENKIEIAAVLDVDVRTLFPLVRAQASWHFHQGISISVAQAADMLGISCRHAHRLASEGRLPGAYRLGRRVLVSVDVLRREVERMASAVAS